MKLLNQGKRTIIHGKFEFRPGALAEFSGEHEETGKKLHRLYKGELISYDDATQKFDGAGVSPETVFVGNDKKESLKEESKKPSENKKSF